MKRLFDNAGTTANHDNWSFPQQNLTISVLLFTWVVVPVFYCLVVGVYPDLPVVHEGLHHLLLHAPSRDWVSSLSCCLQSLPTKHEIEGFHKWFSKFNFSIITILYVLHYNLLFVWRVKMNPCLTTWVLGYLQLI